jgi:DNA polymerase-1
VAAERFIVVDGSNYVFRAYFALRQARPGGRSVQLSTKDGMPTGALHVFSNMLTRLYLDEKPHLCCVVFDAETPTFRNALDPEYKANREAAPDDLIPQFPWFPRIVEAFHLPILKIHGVEADDVIATLVKQARGAGREVSIFSGDKDLMSLVDDHVRVIDTMREITYDSARVVEKFGIPPALVEAFLSLRGDSSDNIPGVEGIGDKTAAKLLQEHGDIPAILAAADGGAIKGKLGERLRDPVQRDNLARSQQLVKLKDDVELPPLDSLVRGDWEVQKLVDVFTELEFTRLVQRINDEDVRRGGQGAVAVVSETTTVVTPAIVVSATASAVVTTPLPVVRAAAGAVTVIGDLGTLRQVVTAAAQAPHVAFAPLTAPARPGTLELVGLGLAWPDAPPAYLPLGHRYLGAPSQLAIDVALAELAPLVDGAPARHVHDTKTFTLALQPHGVILGHVDVDTMLASYLLDATQPAHTLEVLARQHLARELPALDSLLGKGKDVRTAAGTDVAAAAELVGAQAAAILELGPILAARLANAGLAKLHDELERPLARILAEMERLGIHLDVPRLRALGSRIADDLGRLEQEIADDAGGERINLGSPKQLGELLFEKLGLRTDRMRKTKTGGYSTDAEQLEELIDVHPVIKKIIAHRELSKLKGTYLDALPPLVDPATSRLHTSYLQAVATTGRLSSKAPNIQNIPVRSTLGLEIREAFRAEPGWLLVSADYSQIELRVIAHLSQDKTLLHAFHNGIDVHAQTAAEVFGIGLAEVTSHHRRVAKAVNYGLGYGQTDFGLSRALDIPRAEARLYIERYFARFDGVRSYMARAIAAAHETLVVQTLLGRRIAIPQLAARRFNERSAAERLARNAPIQGTAADILKLAMLRCQELVDGAGGCARMLLTVHDELVFEVRAERARAFAELARSAMEGAYPLTVPLAVDVGIAESWADAH